MGRWEKSKKAIYASYPLNSSSALFASGVKGKLKELKDVKSRNTADK
jgi:hypothetical protein